jgi:hypothetical protein
MLQNVQFFGARILRDAQGQAYVNVVCFFDKPGVTVVFHQQGADVEGRPRFALQYVCPPQDIKRPTPQSFVQPINGPYAGGPVIVNDKIIDDAPEDDFRPNPCQI